MGIPVGDGYDARIVAANRCNQQASTGFTTRAPNEIEAAAACLEALPGNNAEYAADTRVSVSVLRHDSRPVLAFRQAVTSAYPADEAEASNAWFNLHGEMLRGPSPALSTAVERFGSAAARRASSGPLAQYYRAALPNFEWPLQAEALSILGRHAEAAALTAKTPLDCYTCVRVRGLVAQAAGDPRAAQRWFAEAARQGPRLAPAFADWGQLLAKHRRFASAEVKIKEAVRLAPNWADPLKTWGDSLAAQGKRAEALAKYDAALKLAPKWAELRQARERVASR
jgi:tetratricopeptide (TPR) repeat protein